MAAESNATHEAGLIGLARNALSTLVALLRNRLELLGVELQEEAVRVLVGLFCGLAALFSATVGLVFTAVALLIAAGDAYRLPVAVLLALGFFVLAGCGVWHGRRVLLAKPRFFDATLTELERDRDSLEPAA